MIACPKCKASLPDWAQSCQFCGTDTKAVARPVAVKKEFKPLIEAPKWVWPAYYIGAAYLMLNGLAGLLMAFVPALAPKGGGSIVFTTFAGIMGLISFALGFGLAAKIEFFRGVVNFVCGLNILQYLLGVAATFVVIPLYGLPAFFQLFWYLVSIGINGLIIFVIGETETRAPNI